MTSPIRQAGHGAAAESRPGDESGAGPFIQGHGALLVLADTPELTVEQASANLAAFLGVEAAAALGRPDLLGLRRRSDTPGSRRW